MATLLKVAEKASWVRLAWKGVALAASTGAALVTVFTALYSYGVLGKTESHKSIGNLGAAWVGLRPATDTASAIGDTVHYAATIADDNGSILVGARPTWTTGDSSIALARPDGSIIARRPGTTTVSVVVNTLVAHSKIVVKQRVAVVELSGGTTSDSIVVAEGAQLPLRARPLDSRGHAVAGLHADWMIEDSAVATVDTAGVLAGRNAGRTTITTKIDGVSKRVNIYVVTTASALALVAGSNQHALAGTTLPQAVVVRATNHRGAPSPGQTVRFKLGAGQGTVTPASIVTDADGRARATWTLGDYPGRQTLLASVEKLDSAFAIQAEADPVARNTRMASLVTEQLTAKAGEQLDDSVSVRLTDSTGHVLADVLVRWVALDGGAVEASAPRTDSLGVASAHWMLGKKTGTQRLQAQVGGNSGGRSIPPVTFTARAVAGAPVGVVVVSGDAQRGSAGAALSKPVLLRVVDENGSGVSDATIMLSPSGGSVPDSSVKTDDSGMIKTRWTMGHSAGDYTLTVHMEGAKKLVKVAAHAVPAAPANLSFDDAPPVSTNEKRSHGKEKAKHLYAVVTDVYGNPVPDVKVSFSTKSGSVTPSRAVTDARGRAAVAWTPGTKLSAQTLLGMVQSTDVRGTYATQAAGAAHEAVPKAVSVKTKAVSLKKKGK